MKRIGTNSEITLTERRVQELLAHQANQRPVLPRHVSALAKLFARTGWRMDQRICLNSRGELINGLQRLSAIAALKDYGWKIPVTTFSDDELTTDVIQSFNIQRNDTMKNMMRRLYGWKDARTTSVIRFLLEAVEKKVGYTPHDLFDAYEHIRQHVDAVLSVKEKKARGDKHIDAKTMAAACCLGLSGVSLSRYFEAANQFLDHNESSPMWKALRDWSLYWRSQYNESGRPLTIEPGDFRTHIAVRYHAIKQFSLGKKIKPIKSLTDIERSELCAEIVSMLKLGLNY